MRMHNHHANNQRLMNKRTPTSLKAISKQASDLVDVTKHKPEIASLPPDQFKSVVATKLQIIVNEMADRIHNELNSIPLSKLPLAYGILQDKYLQLQGEQTTRPQKTVTVSHTDFNKLLAQLPTSTIETPSTPITIAESK